MQWILEYVALLLKIFMKLNSQTDTSELVLVHVVFRHGERTPVVFYPNDPKKDEFKGYKLGEITEQGKLTATQLGKVLSEEYKYVLQNSLRHELEMRSTDLSRTITTAQLVLSELWSETKDKDSEKLDWSKIPIFTKPKQDEDLLKPDECSRRKQLFDFMLKDPAMYDKYLKEYEGSDLNLNYIIQKSGWPINDIFTLMVFYEILKSEEDFGLTLPEWTKSFYPTCLRNAIARCFEYRNEGMELKRINAGYLLQKWLNDTDKKIRNEILTNIFLYSAHDTSIGFLQDIFKTPEPHLPACGSALIMEVHKQSGEYFVKVRYIRDPWSEKIEELKLPNCEAPCLLEKFRKLYSEFLPVISYEDACKTIGS